MGMKPPVALGLLLSLVALASASRPDDTFDLTYSPKVGDTAKFAVAISLHSDQFEVTVHSVGHRKVLAVDANGDYSVEGAQTDAKLKMGEQVEQDLPDSPPTTGKVSAKGDVLKAQVDKSTALGEMLSAATHVLVADKPVAKGEKWSKVLKASDVARIIPATIDYELIGVEKVGTKDCVKVGYKYKETGQAGTGEGFIFLDATTHDMVSVEGTFKSMSPQASAPEMDGEFKFTRLND